MLLHPVPQKRRRLIQCRTGQFGKVFRLNFANSILANRKRKSGILSPAGVDLRVDPGRAPRRAPTLYIPQHLGGGQVGAAAIPRGARVLNLFITYDIKRLLLI
jgi:hypothetical protein